MSTEFLHPYNTKLYYSSDGTLGIGTTFTEVTDMKIVTPPDLDTGEANTTVLTSTGKTEENRPGWNKSGEIPCESRFTQAVYDALLAFKNAGSVVTWKVQLPLLSTQNTPFRWTQAGWVKKLAVTEGSAESDENFIIKFTLRMTGPPTKTDGAA